MTYPLHHPLDAPPQFYSWQGHRIAYYTAGSGRPLLLLHSINAAASAFEMRCQFAGLQDSYQLFALELLGYGASDRPALQYSAELYATLLADFARDVVGAQLPVIVSSLSSAYVVKAAARNSERFGPLVLICPTGIEALAQPQPPALAYRLLRSPLGDAVFSALASRASIQLFLKRQSYYRPDFVTDEVVDGFYNTSHQPGAKWVPICFVTGLLNCDIRIEFGQLQQPVLLVWGREASTTPLRQAKAFLKRNPRARLAVINHAKLSPHDEHAAQFNSLVASFLTLAAAGQSQP